jgi:DNA replication licensing factor MCM5
MDPYALLPDKCQCVDFQQLKLQELPEDVPHSEMPRHMIIYADRSLLGHFAFNNFFFWSYLTDKVTPGNRVTITGVYSIKRLLGGKKGGGGKEEKTAAGMAGIRAPYIRAVGIEVQMSGPGRADQMQFTAQEERQFKVGYSF